MHENDIVVLLAAVPLDGLDDGVHRNAVAGGVRGVHVPVIIEIAVPLDLLYQLAHDPFGIFSAHRVGAAAGEADHEGIVTQILLQIIPQGIDVLHEGRYGSVDLAVIVGFSVDADGAAVLQGPFHQFDLLRIIVIADDKKCGGHVIFLQGLQDLRGDGGAGTVIKGQVDDLFDLADGVTFHGHLAGGGALVAEGICHGVADPVVPRIGGVDDAFGGDLICHIPVGVVIGIGSRVLEPAHGPYAHGGSIRQSDLRRLPVDHVDGPGLTGRLVHVFHGVGDGVGPDFAGVHIPGVDPDVFADVVKGKAGLSPRLLIAVGHGDLHVRVAFEGDLGRGEVIEGIAAACQDTDEQDDQDHPEAQRFLFFFCHL